MVADAPPRMHLVLFTGGAAEVFERGKGHCLCGIVRCIKRLCRILRHRCAGLSGSGAEKLWRAAERWAGRTPTRVDGARREAGAPVAYRLRAGRRDFSPSLNGRRSQRPTHHSVV